MHPISVLTFPPVAVATFSPALIQARNLTRIWGKGNAAQVGITGVDLDITSGEPLAVIGPSGSGRSTLGALIAGIDTPTSGSLVIDGVRIDALKRDKLAAWRGANVGIVFQDFHLLATLTAFEKVELALELGARKIGRRDRRRAVDSALDRVGLAGNARKLPAQMSGGERQRVGMRSRPAGIDVDWHHLEALARRWYQPLLEREGWMAALYLLVGMCSSIGFFIALTAVGFTVFGLCFAGIGLLLIGPFFRMVAAFAFAERTMARWVDVHVDPRPMEPLRGLGIRAVTDPDRWRQVGFLAESDGGPTTITAEVPRNA